MLSGPPCPLLLSLCGPRSCQTSHWKSHRSICGKPDSPSDFNPSATLLRHAATLATSQKASSRPLDFFYYPTADTNISSAPTPRPIALPVPSQKIFAALLKTAETTRNQLSVNLMYSLLLEVVEEQGGTEARLVEQLSEEYGFDLAQALELEEDPSEDELQTAVGGSLGMGLLRKFHEHGTFAALILSYAVEWQMAEAERTR